ncbi:hypothetical protein C8Q79DRAFT_1013204 [Trametes meyenii]|nr:hypothetical protein C8Q79DRAFT_1013204 [Trametes meyenii]
MVFPTSSLRVQFAPNTLAPPAERRSLRSPPPKSRPQSRSQSRPQHQQHHQPPRRQPHQGYGPGCKLISLHEAQARPDIVYHLPEIWVYGMPLRFIRCWREDDVQSEDGAPPSAGLLIVDIGCAFLGQAIGETFLRLDVQPTPSSPLNPGA